MRRKGQPNRPNAITCCRFSSLKTFPMPTKGTNSFAAVNVPVFQLAGFEVIFIGRFCVIAEGVQGFSKESMNGVSLRQRIR